MATLTCSNEQLRLIQDALELYSRIGILQLDHILYHPSVEGMIANQFTSKAPVKVGDHIGRGEVVEIGKDYFKTKGSWGNGEEVRKWTDMDALKHWPDYGKLHPHYDEIKRRLNDVKNLIAGDPLIQSQNASYGIHRTKEGQHNIEAYDMIQVIRNEFWKAQENPPKYVVSADVTKWSTEPLIKVEL